MTNVTRRDHDGLFQPVELPDGRFTSVALPGFWLEAAQLWREPLPSYRQVLQAVFDGGDAFPPGLRAL